MSDFPITIERTSLLHRQGTKAYHSVLITTHSGKGLVIFRWGKAGQFGQMQILGKGSSITAQSTKQNKLREKQSSGGGYSLNDGPRLEVANSVEEFKKLLGPQYISQFGADNLTHLSTEFDGTKTREPPPVRLDEEGRLIPQDPSAFIIPDPPPTPVSVAEKRAKNSDWGLF